jgi:hypothetical protein
MAAAARRLHLHLPCGIAVPAFNPHTLTPTQPPTCKPMLSLCVPPCRRFTWTEVQRRIEPVLAPPTLGNASLGHGAYYWDQDTTTLTLKLRGGAEAVEIRTEAAIQVCVWGGGGGGGPGPPCKSSRMICCPYCWCKHIPSTSPARWGVFCFAACTEARKHSRCVLYWQLW